MPETVEIDTLIGLLHRINGHRLALLHQFLDDDRERAARHHGETVAYRTLILALKEYQETGEFGEPSDPERYDAYADMSRAFVRAEELAEVEPEPEPEVGTFQ